MSLIVGARVRVTPDEGWTKGARLSMHGMVGVVDEIATTHHNGREHVPIKPKYAIRFDERPVPWSANQIPSHTWWFSVDELEVL